MSLVAVVVAVAVAFSTARHWTKVDVAEHPTTFRGETCKTGKFVVTDNHRNPCTVGEDWIACIGEMEEEYNDACTAGTGRFADSYVAKSAVFLPGPFADARTTRPRSTR